MTKRYAPATERNREAILAILQEHLPDKGTILEIASGTGQHAAFFQQLTTHTGYPRYRFDQFGIDRELASGGRRPWLIATS